MRVCWTLSCPTHTHTHTHTHAHPTPRTECELLREPFLLYSHLPLRDPEIPNPHQIPRFSGFSGLAEGRNGGTNHKKVTSERIVSMSAPHLPAQGAKMMRAMGCIAEGLHEPGWGALKHSSFLPALTPQRENSTNLINASTVARSIKIPAHLVFCSPFSPSKVLQFHIPPLSKLGIMLSFQPRSCASICLEHPCPPIKLKLPTLQGPHSRPPFLRQV